MTLVFCSNIALWFKRWENNFLYIRRMDRRRGIDTIVSLYLCKLKINYNLKIHNPQEGNKAFLYEVILQILYLEKEKSEFLTIQSDFKKSV
jgi:hypothetical protein